MSRTQRLELTWIGKETRPRLEPRVLVFDPSTSYHSASGKHGNLFDNKLIYGDNLLALKAIENEYASRVKCAFIDPPYNTGSAFEHYDDGVEHSVWLDLMHHRLPIIRNLLSEDGSIWIMIDENEPHYLKVLCYEVFGRQNFVVQNAIKRSAPTGHKSINPTPVQVADYCIVYAKNKTVWKYKPQYVPREFDKNYNKFIINAESPVDEWEIITLRQAMKRLNKDIDELLRLSPRSIIRFAQPDFDGVGKETKELIVRSKNAPGKIIVQRREGFPDIYLLGGERILFYADKIKEIDGVLGTAELLTNIWLDIGYQGIAKEGGVEFPKGKKPEKLVKRAIDIATEPGDIVLDSFAGSGTTGAVAHKMGRRWIMVELGEHCHTHIIPRMRSVIDGTDATGVTEAVGWKGGGGFRYYRLAPSLIERDQWGQPVISPAYNAAMLAEAMCKLMGFRYEPSADVFWQQGRSSERDFIYTTTRTLAHEDLAAISAQVGDDRSLLICCKAFRMAKPDAFPNLTVKKIPNAVLAKCEWGKDDYSLNVANLPMAAPVEEPAAPARTKRRSTAPDLFDQATAEEEPGA